MADGDDEGKHATHGSGAVAAVHAAARDEDQTSAVVENSPHTRRRARLLATPASFIVAILAVAAIVAAIILVIYAFGGFGEGSEGALGLAR